ADVRVAQGDRFPPGELEDLLGHRGERDVPARYWPGGAVTAGSGSRGSGRADQGPPGPASAAPVAHEPGRPGDGVPGPALVRYLGGAGERLRAERRLAPGPHRVQVDPDRGQRVPVEPGEQARPGAQPDPAHDLL